MQLVFHIRFSANAWTNVDTRKSTRCRTPKNHNSRHALTPFFVVIFCPVGRPFLAKNIHPRSRPSSNVVIVRLWLDTSMMTLNIHEMRPTSEKIYEKIYETQGGSRGWSSRGSSSCDWSYRGTSRYAKIMERKSIACTAPASSGCAQVERMVRR
jgi:hypothetical protein